MSGVAGDAAGVFVALVVALVAGRAWARVGRRLPRDAAVRRLALGAVVGGVGVAVLVPVTILLAGGTLRATPLREATDPRLVASVTAMQGAELTIVVFAWMLGERLGTVRAALRWFAAAVAVAAGALACSAGWSVLLSRLGIPAQDQAIVGLTLAAPLSVRLRIGFAIAVVAPVLEELVFRGWAQPALSARFGPRAGVVLTALGFTALHLDAPQVGVPVLLLASGLGWLRARSGSVWPGVLAHALNNTAALVLSGVF